MAIGLTEDQQALASSVAEWTLAINGPTLVKASEDAGPAAFEPAAKGLADLGIAGIALPEHLGGAGGSLVDLAVAVEACAAGMVPGSLLTSAVAGLALAGVESPAGADGRKEIVRGIAAGEVTVALGLGQTTLSLEGTCSGQADLVWGAGVADHLLLPTTGPEWVLLRADQATIDVAEPLDLASRVGSVTVDQAAPLCVVRLEEGWVRSVAVALAAAEAAGIARWCLDTAVAYAKVREQFGRPIGSFQTIKHLCAEMLESAESATAVAWDAASAFGDEPDQLAVAAAVAGASALDLAVDTAHQAIQVLGGIGFTWEHDAHLYLRRALVNRMVLGGAEDWRLRLADLATAGVRRVAHIQLGPEASGVRAEITPLVSSIAAAPAGVARTAWVETGLLMPHWPAPYGRGADPREQLVIDEEVSKAGLTRPSLDIGAWAAPTVLVHGDDAQRERFLWPTLRGEIAWCQLFSEPGAGSDLASLRTRAERVEGGWALTGQKVWTSVAAEADWGICLARTNPDAAKHRGISYFLIDMASAGIEIRPLRELTGEALFNEVFLDEVFVPDACVVGDVDGGWALARTTLANERVAISDSSLGVSVERAVAAVSADPAASAATRSRVGAAVADAATAKALGLRATLRSLAGEGPGAESSVLKLVGVRQRQDSAQLALDLLANDVLLGRGVGPAVAHEALVTRCLSIAGGTTQVLRNVVGERILGLPRD